MYVWAGRQRLPFVSEAFWSALKQVKRVKMSRWLALPQNLWIARSTEALVLSRGMGFAQEIWVWNWAHSRILFVQFWVDVRMIFACWSIVVRQHASECMKKNNETLE